MDLKDKMKQYRKENNITQKELGDMLGLKRSTIAEIERGRIKGKLSIINKLAEISGMSINYWVGESDTEISMNKYDALDILLDAMIEKGIIQNDGKIPESYQSIVIGLLEKEIALKLEKATK